MDHSETGNPEASSAYFMKLGRQCPRSTQSTLERSDETADVSSETGNDAQMTESRAHPGRGKCSKQKTGCGRKRKFTQLEEARRPESCSELVELNYTALERQYLELKEKHPDVLLLIETGYLFRFFGQDAEIASKELKFNTSCRHNFVTTSLPFHRMHIHIRRLVALGHKVGVVRKTETALMKAAGDNQHGVFKRELTTLYSKSTLIGEEVDPPTSTETPNHLHIQGNSMTYLMCLYELPINNCVRIGIFAACPLSGDLIYDCFLDEDKRQNLESRFAHIRPVDVLVPQVSLSEETERVISAALQSQMSGEEIRVERMADEFFKFQCAEKTLREFYDGTASKSGDCDTFTDDPMNDVMNLPPPVICCMGATLEYLKDFHLEYIFRLVKDMKAFSPSSRHVYLDTRTIHTLELFHSSMTGRREGSLLWLLDQTSTIFGSRLLHSWLSQPLKNSQEIQQRLDAVDEILKQMQATSVLASIKLLLEEMPDLESGIMAIFYKKCSTKKYWKTITSMIHVKHHLECVMGSIDSEITEPHLRQLLLSTVFFLKDIEVLRANLNREAVRYGYKDKLFKDLTPYPVLCDLKQFLQETKQKLDDLQPGIASDLGRKKFCYSKFSDKEYVIVINASSTQDVPTDWKIVAQTSKNTCFRTPEMVTLVNDLKLLQEQFKYACHLAWLDYLENFRPYYHLVRQAVLNLATLDCYFSFATLAKSEDFVKPSLESGSSVSLNFEDVSHPVIRRLLGPDKQFVCNSTALSTPGHLCRIITGANMGGKTSYVRAVAIVAILAQIGSFVPASAARLTPLDAIFARSGVRDCITKGRSAFCVEAGEVSDIFPRVTFRSLVLLDEFGRSTSDSDGASLAYGVLRHLVATVRCLSLVISRFPEVSKLQDEFPGKVANYHVSVLTEQPADPTKEDQETIIYLYRLEEGMCDRGYAKNVCRLAGIDDAVLKAAVDKSTEMERNSQNYHR